MFLEEVEVGKEYTIEDVVFCTPCKMSTKDCNVLQLMERGFMPGETLKVINKSLGLYHLKIGTSNYAIRKEDTKNIIVK